MDRRETERLRATCSAAKLTGSARYWDSAEQAARTLLRYLDTPRRGLWYDVMNVDGTLVDEPAPASSFYHLVASIRELDRSTAGLASAP